MEIAEHVKSCRWLWQNGKGETGEKKIVAKSRKWQQMPLEEWIVGLQLGISTNPTKEIGVYNSSV